MPTGWKGRPKWTADQWKEYRRSKGIPPKSDMPTILPPHIAAAGKELCAMMALPLLDWDEKLFTDIPAGLQDPKKAAPNLCHYKGCMTLHNNRVSATKTVGNTHHVRWFCCGEHQRKWYATGSPL